MMLLLPIGTLPLEILHQEPIFNNVLELFIRQYTLDDDAFTFAKDEVKVADFFNCICNL